MVEEPSTRKDMGLCHCMIASLHGAKDLEQGGNCDCHHCQRECYCGICERCGKYDPCACEPATQGKVW